jgi:molybdopterin-containing oxidoreductase family membrane subunit
MPFDRLLLYWPSWQEFAAFGFVVAYGMLVYSFSYRYLMLFPQERELAMTEARR